MNGFRFVIIMILLATQAANAASRKAAVPSLEELVSVSESVLLTVAKAEPDLLLTAQAAYRYAGLDGHPERDWRKKARQSAALPTLTLGVDTGYLNRANVSLQDSIAVNSTGVTIGPPSSDSNQYLSNQTMFTAKAIWSLPDVIFHRQGLNIEREARNRIAAREKILDQINQLYHERIRLKAALLGSRRSRMTGRAALQSALMQVTGQLNLLTGGWFADQIEGEGKV